MPKDKYVPGAPTNIKALDQDSGVGGGEGFDGVSWMPSIGLESWEQSAR